MTKKSTIARCTWPLLLAAGISGASAEQLPAGPDTGDASAGLRDMVSATLTIETVSHVRTDRVGDSVWTVGAGSGVLVSSERCEVWTNHHVIEDAAFLEARVDGANGPRRIPAKLVGATEDPDLAVLELEQCDGIAQAPVGSSASLNVGDVVYAAGNPFGANPNTLTRGIVSNTARFKDSATTYIQTDAAINKGSSGGPLFDARGRIVGINTAIMTTRSNVGTGIAYAIPVDTVKRTVAQIRAGRPERGDIGLSGIINLVEPDVAALLGVPDGLAAVCIGKAPDEGSAANVLQMRDVIFRIAGDDVRAVGQVERLIAGIRPGERVDLDVVRDGTLLTVNLVVGNGWHPPEPPAPEEYEGLLGLELTSWADEPGPLGNYKHPVITRIHDLGPAHAARISASQKIARAASPVLAGYLVDVRMVTGAVLEGRYVPIDDVATLSDLTHRAHSLHAPLLLEVASWRPENPRRPGINMALYNTAFHKVIPAPSIGQETESGINLTSAAPPPANVAWGPGI